MAPQAQRFGSIKDELATYTLSTMVQQVGTHPLWGSSPYQASRRFNEASTGAAKFSSPTCCAQRQPHPAGRRFFAAVAPKGCASMWLDQPAPDSDAGGHRGVSLLGVASAIRISCWSR